MSTVHFHRIIIVDDDSICNFVTEEILLKNKYSERIFSFTNVDAARNYILENPIEPEEPELLLLDIYMPGLTGFELVESLEKLGVKKPERNNHNLFIVYITSSNKPQDIEKSRNHRVAGYINKPLTAPKLRSVIDVISMKKSIEE